MHPRASGAAASFDTVIFSVRSLMALLCPRSFAVLLSLLFGCIRPANPTPPPPPPQQVHGSLFAVHCLGMLGGDRAATTAGAVLCKTAFVQPEACSIVLSQLTRRNPREIVAPVRTLCCCVPVAFRFREPELRCLWVCK